MARASKAGGKQLSLQGRLLAAIREAESWPEAKLLLVMDGWDVAAEDVAVAIRRILLRKHGANKVMSSIMHGLENYDPKRQMEVADILKGMWTDVVGPEDRDAAKNEFFRLVGIVDWANRMMAAKTSVNVNNNVRLNVLGSLTAWFGQLARPKDS